ncbi:Uncharacterised protein [Streptococcus pneumoniae]|nr:Uncharacterised protein [Streptococcus pneumoniae]
MNKKNKTDTNRTASVIAFVYRELLYQAEAVGT